MGGGLRQHRLRMAADTPYPCGGAAETESAGGINRPKSGTKICTRATYSGAFLCSARNRVRPDFERSVPFVPLFDEIVPLSKCLFFPNLSRFFIISGTNGTKGTKIYRNYWSIPIFYL